MSTDKVQAEKKFFSKKQLILSKRFECACDMLEAVLEDGKKYTIEQAEERLESYRKRKVK